MEKSINETVYGAETGAPSEEISHEEIGVEETKEKVNRFGSLFDKLRTPVLEKPIEDYRQHAFNRSGSDNVGRFIRGVEAFLGNTNLALFDVVFGAWGMVEERGGSKPEVGVHGV